MSKFFLILIIVGLLGFVGSRIFHMEGYLVAFMSVFGVLLAYFFNGYGKEERNNREYEGSPLNSGSYANFINQSAGIAWTQKKHLDSEKDGVYIDEFIFSWEALKRFNLLQRLVFNTQKKEMFFAPLTFVRGSLIIGGMGSGKTEFLNSLLDQKFYMRAIIHDIKGDFVEKFYMRKDIILNPFDRRGTIWDIFEEAKKYPKIADSFFQTLLNGVLGGGSQNSNFFTSSAKERFVKIFNTIQVQELDNKEKWSLFIQKIDLYFQEVQELNQKSEKDVVSTMKLLVEYFEYMNYLIQNGAKTFTITHFLKSNKKLFLLNNPTYSDFLTPYFSAFIDSFSKIFMAEMVETKTNLTLFLFDEYLSFLPLLTEDTKTILHTLVRSRGGCLMPAIHYLPEDKKLRQNLLNSAENIFLFQTSDTATTAEIKEIIGKAEYSAQNRSEDTTSYTTAREYLLTDNIVKEIGDDYSHITFCQSSQQLYRGYTRLTKKEKRHKAFEVGKFNDFINHKYITAK